MRRFQAHLLLRVRLTFKFMDGQLRKFNSRQSESLQAEVETEHLELEGQSRSGRRSRIQVC